MSQPWPPHPPTPYSTSFGTAGGTLKCQGQGKNSRPLRLQCARWRICLCSQGRRPLGWRHSEVFNEPSCGPEEVSVHRGKSRKEERKSDRCQGRVLYSGCVLHRPGDKPGLRNASKLTDPVSSCEGVRQRLSSASGSYVWRSSFWSKVGLLFWDRRAEVPLQCHTG